MVRAGMILGIVLSVIFADSINSTVLSAQSRWIRHIAWHNNVIAVGNSEDIWIYDDVTLQEIDFIDGSLGLSAIKWQPNANRLAILGGDGLSLELSVWNMTTQTYDWRIPISISYGYEAPALSWSNDGRLLAVGLFDEVHIFESNTGNLSQKLEDFDPYDRLEVMGIAWTPDNQQMVTTSYLNLQVWDVATGSLVTTLLEDFGMKQLAWLGGTSKVAVVHGFDIDIWDVASSQLMITLTGDHNRPINSLIWNDSGGLVSASFDGVIQTWDVNSGQVKGTLTVSNMGSADWSPDGSQLIYGGRDGLFEVKSLPTANPGPNQTITDADNDGSELVTLDGTASSDSDGTIDTYEWLENGTVIAEGANPQVELEVGEYTITLKVTDNDGLVDMAEVVVEAVAP